MELQGRTVLVAGAGRNNGRTIALTLAREGANLVLVSRQRQEELDDVAAGCDTLGVETMPLLADLTDAAAVHDVVARGEAKLGPIDTLVSVLGVRPHHQLVNTTHEEWHHVFDVNLHAT